MQSLVSLTPYLPCRLSRTRLNKQESRKQLLGHLQLRLFRSFLLLLYVPPSVGGLAVRLPDGCTVQSASLISGGSPSFFIIINPP